MGNTAVIILNYNTWEDTIEEACLVHDAVGVDQNDIIVIDNCSPNNSSEELKKLDGVRYKFLESEENRGYASGNNIGLRYDYEQGYKCAWTLNNDIIIDDKNILESLKKVLGNK